MKRPLPLILLMLWFVTAAVKAIHALFAFSSMADYHILKSTGFAPLFFMFGVPMAALYTTAAYYMIRPRIIGYYLALAGIVMASLENLTTVVIATMHIETVREEFMSARMLGEFGQRGEVIAMVFNPSTMFFGLAIALALYAVLAFVVVKNRAHFFTRPPTSMLA